MLLYMLVNLVINVFIINNTSLKKQQVNILMAGDSHVQNSIDPGIFTSARNIAQSAEPYLMTFWKLSYIFDRMKVDTLILGFSHQNLAAFNDRKFSEEEWSYEMFSRGYPLHNFLGDNEGLEIDYRDCLSVYIKKLCLYPKLHHLPFMGHYQGISHHDVSDVEEAIRRHYYNGDDMAGVSERSIAYLDSIVDLCRQNEVQLIMVGTPVFPEYYERIPPQIKLRYEQIKKDLEQEYDHISVIDMTEHFYEEEYYLNSDHLNKEGAGKFSGELKKRLQPS